MAAILLGSLCACESNNSLMRKEADAFLVRMGANLQPGQRDAILEAVGGDNGKLVQTRAARNSRPVYPENVKVTHPTANTRLYTNTGADAGDRPLLIYLHGGGGP